MNSSCRSIRGALPAFAAEDLDAETAARVRTHLVGCNACRVAAAAAARAARALQSSGPLPAACDAAWFEGLHRSITSAVGMDAPVVAVPRTRRTASVAAAAALFVAGLAASAGWSAGGGLHTRPPIRIAGDVPEAAAAGRASMLPLGQEQWLGPHPGLMGRLEFRTLEQFEGDGVQLRPPSQDQAYPSARRVAPAQAPAADPAAGESRR